MPHLRLNYVNVEHAGRTNAGDGGPYDYNRVTAMLHDGDRPDILVIGFTDHNTRNSCSDLPLPVAPRSVVLFGVRWSQ